MRRAEHWSDAAAGRVVHLVGPVTDEVFSFLGPATTALAEFGVAQTVVLVDDSRCRHLLPRFHESVQLVLTPGARNPLRRWRQFLQAGRQAVREGPLKALHLHGFLPYLFLPYLMGRAVALSLRPVIPLYYSPHGSRSLGRLKGAAAFVLWASQPLLRQSAQRPIATIAAEARTLRSMTREVVDLVESPVASAFFSVPRNEARRPLIVTSKRTDDPRSADLFAQLAVLLGGEPLKLGFNWIGTADAKSMLRLKAAGVAVFDPANDAERASRLAAGWIYLAPSDVRGFPVRLAEAMAVGLPCVAIDNVYHRDVIRHGETGYLCRTAEEMLRRVAQLVDEPALREEIGRAACDEAKARFSHTTFRDSLFASYDLHEY